MAIEGTADEEPDDLECGGRRGRVVRAVAAVCRGNRVGAGGKPGGVSLDRQARGGRVPRTGERAGPRVIPPAEKVTVPLGVLPLLEVTVAVSVALPPAEMLAGLAASVMEECPWSAERPHASRYEVVHIYGPEAGHLVITDAGVIADRRRASGASRARSRYSQSQYYCP